MIWLVVISLLILFFAISFMLFQGHTSVNFSTFADSLLSVWLLTLGNIEYLDLLFREGPERIWARAGLGAFVFYIIYHWLIVVILMSLFIAVLTAGYEKAKHRVRERIRYLNDSFRGVWEKQQQS